MVGLCLGFLVIEAVDTEGKDMFASSSSKSAMKTSECGVLSPFISMLTSRKSAMLSSIASRLGELPCVLVSILVIVDVVWPSYDVEDVPL